MQYTGRDNDGATGLYYYRARYYSPQLGRFISEDPLGAAAGTNYYQYANGNPIALRDPLGLWAPSSLPDGVANGVTGFGDGVYAAITFGLGDLNAVRNAIGINGGFDPCSTSYRGGKYGGYAWGAGTLWAAGLNGGSQSVFWSGYANGARGIAEAVEGTTLESTPIGRLLDFASNSLGIPGLTPIWNLASATFALNASGTATAVLLAEGATWTTIELPILTARGIAVSTVF